MATTLVAGERFYYDGRTVAKGESFECQAQDVTLLTWYQTPKAVAATGGDLPGWVPANAKIHIDLVGNRAWTETDGEVAIDTLLGSDPNTENAWGETSYDPANQTENGYVQSSAIATIGAARDLLVAGATFRVQCKQVESSFNTIFVDFCSADGAAAIHWTFNDPDLACASVDGPLDVFVTGIANSGVGSINAVALTLVSGRMDMAANGSTVSSGAPNNVDRPPETPLVAWIVFAMDQAIQSITIYDPLPTTAGLSALSAVT